MPYYPSSSPHNVLIASRYSTLQEAVSALGGATTLLVDDAIDIGGNPTVPATALLQFTRGGSITGSGTLTVDGEIDAGLHQIFGSSIVLAGSIKNPFLLVEWFGCVADGTTDCTVALTRANTAAHALRRPLYFATGVYNVNGTTQYAIDAADTAWLGEKTILDVKTAPANATDYVIKLHGTSTYSLRYEVTRVIMKNISLLGGHQAAPMSGIGILIEDDGEFGTNNFQLHQVNVDGFTTLIKFGVECWGITLDGGRYRWGNIVTNVGYHERMVLRSCQFGGDVNGVRPYVELAGGDWYFDGCSFDNQELRVVDSADQGNDVHVTNTHFENPSSIVNNAYFAQVAGANSRLSIYHCNLMLRDPGSNYECALFNADSTAKAFILEDFRVSLPDLYRSEVNDTNRILVAGTGRVRCSNFVIEEGAKSPVSAMLNLANNDGFETGNFTAWTEDNVTGTTQVQGTTKYAGSYAARFDVNTAGTYNQAQIYQAFDVTPGQHVLLSCWAKATLTGVGRMNFRFNFYDSAGNTIELNTSSVTTSHDWAVRSAGQIAPPKATRVNVVIGGSASGAAGTVEAYLDSVIVNIV